MGCKIICGGTLLLSFSYLRKKKNLFSDWRIIKMQNTVSLPDIQYTVISVKIWKCLSYELVLSAVNGWRQRLVPVLLAPQKDEIGANRLLLTIPQLKVGRLVEWLLRLSKSSSKSSKKLKNFKIQGKICVKTIYYTQGFFFGTFLVWTNNHSPKIWVRPIFWLS